MDELNEDLFMIQTNKAEMKLREKIIDYEVVLQ